MSEVWSESQSFGLVYARCTSTMAAGVSERSSEGALMSLQNMREAYMARIPAAVNQDTDELVVRTLETNWLTEGREGELIDLPVVLLENSEDLLLGQRTNLNLTEQRYVARFYQCNQIWVSVRIST